MHKIVSKEELFDAIDQEIGWRKKELKVLKDNIPNKNTPLQIALLRSSTALLYAHWEGYVKKVCEYYLEYVSERNEFHKNLKPQFIALSMKKHFGKLETRTLEDNTKIVEFLIESINKRANIDVKGCIQTKSNLKFDVFKNIGFTINLDMTRFVKYETLINDLVEFRNNIAHGVSHKVALSTYETMYNDIIEAMEVLRTELQNAVVLYKYKAMPS